MRILSAISCLASLHCDEYGHLRTWNIYNAGKTLYMDRNCACSRVFITFGKETTDHVNECVEAQHQHM